MTSFPDNIRVIRNCPGRRVIRPALFFIHLCFAFVLFAGTALAGQSGLKSSETKKSESRSGENRTVAPAKKIASTCWQDLSVEPRAVLLCIHGLSLHRGTYAEFGKEISRAGIIVYAIDLRGFGESQIAAKAKRKLDFDGCLADIKQTVLDIHTKHPGLPVVILGESMGGAVALRAAALYPELLSGLISSAPAKDRFSLGPEAVLKVGSHLITGGFDKPIENVTSPVVKRVSSKEELRSRWQTDPLMRNDFSAKELMQFSDFMNKNLNYAPKIKEMPVLFIVGAHDKLVKPAGTWRIYESLGSAKKQLVLSKNSEHLIFEAGQFNTEDMRFVATWLDRNVAKLPANMVASKKEQPAVLSTNKKPDTTHEKNTDNLAVNKLATNKTSSTALYRPDATPSKTEPVSGLNYWIEMNRGGKIFRCNNKTEFRSGDQIRFHVIPQSDGYAYLLMVAGTTGKSMLLFPTEKTGSSNFLKKGKDYAIPGPIWLQFDNTPGIEKLSLVFSKEPMDIKPEMFSNSILTCYVSPGADGAKDIVPTRMKLSWEDTTPVALPEDFEAGEQLAKIDRSLVRLVSNGVDGYFAVEIALIHH